MGLKEILVHVDTAPNVEDRIETAAKLAREHGAVLTGLFIISKPRVPGDIRAQILSDFTANQEKSASAAADRAEQLFREVTARAGVATDWYRAEGNPAETLCLHGRYADLVILGQHHPDYPVPAGAEEIPVQPIMSTGRPIFLLPYEASFRSYGKRMAIAWDASRLAARAVGDALPLLQRAESVTILIVNPDGGPAGRGNVAGAAIRHYLARHEVDATVQHLKGEATDASRKLQDGAAEAGADTVVMGAYGHVRWRELVLGGVTAHMMRNAKTAVLMSH